MSTTPSSHRHDSLCPETVEHAEAHTPIYDEAAWDHGLAPLPVEVQS